MKKVLALLVAAAFGLGSIPAFAQTATPDGKTKAEEKTETKAEKKRERKAARKAKRAKAKAKAPEAAPK